MLFVYILNKYETVKSVYNICELADGIRLVPLPAAVESHWDKMGIRTDKGINIWTG